MAEWKPEGKARALGRGVDLQYLRGPKGEGGHEVRFPSGGVLTMLPDSTTTARKRVGLVSVALGEPCELEAMVIGELVLLGATNLLYGGRPLFPTTGGRWVVELADAGEVSMRYVEGAKDDQGARELGASPPP